MPNRDVSLRLEKSYQNPRAMPRDPQRQIGSGRRGLAAVPVTYPDRTVEAQVSGPVRRDARAVGEQLPGVLEDHDAIAEQAPSLLRVADNSVCRFAVRSRGFRTGRRVWAHFCASWTVHRVWCWSNASVPQVVRSLYGSW
jgi:hypothetical protein